MGHRSDVERVPREAILQTIGRGRPFSPEIDEQLAKLLGTPAGCEGLSRVLQPSFPGVRTFVIQPRLDTDGSIHFTVVGVARDGAPAWIGERILLRGPTGGLEIFHVRDAISSRHRSRNITVDTLARERELLATLTSENGARITLEAQGPSKYICAMHGFVFADETKEGRPPKSSRAFDTRNDRSTLKEAASAFAERMAKKRQLKDSALSGALELISKAEHPFHFAEVPLEGLNLDVPEEGLATPFGRAFMLGDGCPTWSAALYREGAKGTEHVGEAYRSERSQRARSRLVDEIEKAKTQLSDSQRASRISGLKSLGMIASSAVLPLIRPLTEDSDRRVAAVAKKTVEQVTWNDVWDKLLAFGQDASADASARGIALRILAEYQPSKLEPITTMLRVNPDARLQRAIVPTLMELEEPGPDLAAMLAANPWSDSRASNRPGLLELRLELIDHLVELADPRALPVLTEALAAQPPPPAMERVALSRALVAQDDPRARVALSSASRHLDRPEVP